MVKDPWVTDGTTPDHEAGSSGGVEVVQASLTVYDVPICDDGAGHFCDGLPDPVGVDGSLVAFFYGASMDGEEVDGVFFEKWEKGMEFVLSLEADTSFYGEGEFSAGFAQAGEEGADLGGFTEETTSGIFTVDDGSWATEV